MNEKIVFVTGSEGYIGNALVQRLLASGYSVVAFDDYSRHHSVETRESKSITPYISSKQKEETFGQNFKFFKMDIISEFNEFVRIFKKYKPGTLVNLAHQPSGPFSMIDREHAEYTLLNNIMSTNNFLWLLKMYPECHYVTIGSTGEYSHYSNIDIEEGYFTCEHNGRTSEEMIYPRRPTSIYHTSKVSATYLIDYCTRMWNLKTTDVMQAVVFGLFTDESVRTGFFSRFDTDECFGTVINRFIAQALSDQPLTVFGEGNHKRGFIALNDSVQALMIAIQNSPEPGKARVWNQLSEWHSINDIVSIIKRVKPDINVINVPSPRNEITTDHYYNYIHEKLPALGYKPTRTIEDEIAFCFKFLMNLEIPKIGEPQIKF